MYLCSNYACKSGQSQWRRFLLLELSSVPSLPMRRMQRAPEPQLPNQLPFESRSLMHGLGIPGPRPFHTL